MRFLISPHKRRCHNRGRSGSRRARIGTTSAGFSTPAGEDGNQSRGEQEGSRWFGDARCAGRDHGAEGGAPGAVVGLNAAALAPEDIIGGVDYFVIIEIAGGNVPECQSQLRDGWYEMGVAEDIFIVGGCVE